VFQDVEMPVVHELARMELVGVGIDREYCCILKTKTFERMGELERLAERMAGHVVNLMSSPQVAQVLFDELGLPNPCTGERRNTNAEVML
jgi:DNA polymerase-1